MYGKPSSIWIALSVAGLISALLVLGCEPSPTQRARITPPGATAIPGPTLMVVRAPREGPLKSPTHCPQISPAFWPTGMPMPTRGPAAVKRMIPTDKETCLQMEGFVG